jgi:hypothetical protein
LALLLRFGLQSSIAMSSSITLAIPSLPKQLPKAAAQQVLKSWSFAPTLPITNNVLHSPIKLSSALATLTPSSTTRACPPRLQTSKI